MVLAQRLNRWADGLFAFFTHRITNGSSAGINNLIKVLKRRAYGFSDFHYFTLKIRDATGALPHWKPSITHSFEERAISPSVLEW